MSFQWLLVPLFLSFFTIRTSGMHLSLNPARRATTELANHHELGFSTTIFLGGEDFVVMVDLDSSDLWVAGEVVRSKDAASTSTVQYGTNTVPGSIKIAKLEFMDIDIDNQAFLQVDDDSFKVSGVLGIGPGLDSSIYNSFQTSAGLSVMDHVFLGKSRIRKYITLLWERGDDPKDRIPGDLTIGELLDEYEDVDSMPKIPITSGEHLQILLDEDGVVGPDGQAIPLGLPPTQKQAKVILTSLTPFNKVPSAVAEAIYSKANGAELSNVTVDGIGEAWLVPCHLEINVTLKLHGESYPIHPWDTVMPPELLGVHADQVTGVSGERLCMGSFQPLHLNQYQYDISLGWSFLRNVYTLIGFGDELTLENGTVTHRGPYVKMLSVTKANKAHEQFTAFLNAEDDPHIEHGTSVSGSGSEPKEKGDELEVEGQSATGTVLGIAATTFGLVIVVAVFTLWLSKQDFCRRHRKQHHNSTSKSQINMESFGKPPHIVHIPGHPPPSPHKNGSLRGRDLV